MTQSQPQPPTPPRREPPTGMVKFVNPVLVFLLKRNIGPLGKQLMVIRHTGRKTGKPYEIPIGYVRDGADIFGFTLGGVSQWYKNTAHNPEVTITIQGKPIRARVERRDSPAEVAHILDVYKRLQPANYERFFGVSLALPPEQAAVSPDLRAKYVQFIPLS
ncbi:MAG: nitroreductase family deazaflavin-dependent oxidoreductase [bacterium]|nr:nitroreductase family deazaflavin-dependent oxidoreductase [bacterium]